MPPKGKGKGGKSSKGGWRSDGGTKTVSLDEFLASSGGGLPSTVSAGVGSGGTDLGVLHTLVTALANPASQSLHSRTPGPPRTIKLASADEERRLVAAYALLKEKEAMDEKNRIRQLVDEGMKARLGSPEKNPGVKQSARKNKKAKVDIVEDLTETSSEAEGPESPGPLQPSRGAKHRKKLREELSSLRDALPALMEFKETMMELLTADKAGGSDDDSAGAKSGGTVMRQLRRAYRTYTQQTTPTPSPLGTADQSVAAKEPKGMSSRTKRTASRALNGNDLDKDTDPSDTGSEGSTKMRALWEHFKSDTPTPSSTEKKTIPKKQSPINYFKATLDSLKGAGMLVDKEKFPIPDEKYAKTLSATDIDVVAPMVKKITTIMGKAAMAMKTKRKEADLAAKSMIVDGLGDHIGYRMPRGMDLSLYLASLLVWLMRAKIDFGQDPYMEQLIS